MAQKAVSPAYGAQASGPRDPAMRTSPTATPTGASCAGWLEMKAGDSLLWEVRRVHLWGNRVECHQMESTIPDESFVAARVETVPTQSYTFIVYTHSGGQFTFRAESKLLMAHWVECLEEGIQSATVGRHVWDHLRCDGCPPSKRAGHSAVLVGSTIYIFGGQGPHYCYDDLYRLHLERRQWELVPLHSGKPPSPRRNQTMAAVQCGTEMALIICGGEDGGGRVFGDVHRFTLSKETWNVMQCNGEPTPKLTQHSCCVHHNLMYIYGGYGPLAGPSTALRCNGDLLVFDPDGALWAVVEPSNGSTMPEPRRGHSCAVYGDRMWIFGGINDRGLYLSSLFTFDFISGIWSHVRVEGWDMTPTRLAFHTAHILAVRPSSSRAHPEEHTEARTSLYVFGGLQSSPDGCENSDRLLRVLVAGRRGGVWSVVSCAAGPPPLAHMASVICGGRLFVIGGSEPEDKLCGDVFCIDLEAVEAMSSDEVIQDDGMSDTHTTPTTGSPLERTLLGNGKPDVPPSEASGASTPSDDQPEVQDMPGLIEELQDILQQTVVPESHISLTLEDQISEPVRSPADISERRHPLNHASPRKDTGKAQPLLKIAASLMEEKKYEEALKVLEGAAQACPFDALVQYNTACCCSLLGRKADALGHLSTAIDCGFRSMKSLREDPDLTAIRGTPQFQTLLAKLQNPVQSPTTQLSTRDQDRIDELIMKAELKLRSGEFEPAVALLKQARAIGPKQPLIHYNLACTYSLMNKRSAGLESLEEAVRCGFDSLENIMEDPDLENIRHMLEFKDLQRRLQSAVSPVTTPASPATDTPRSSSVLSFGGLAEQSAALWAGAAAPVAAAVDALKIPFGVARAEPEADVASSSAAEERAIEKLIRKGDYAAALRLLTRNATACPTPTVYYNIACVKALMNKRQGALQALRKAVELGFTEFQLLDEDPDLEILHGHPDFLRLKADLQQKLYAASVNDHVRQSVHLLREGDIVGALEALLDAEMADPRNAEVQARLSICFAILARRTSSAEAMDRAIASDLNDVQAVNLSEELAEVLEGSPYQDQVKEQRNRILQAIQDQVDQILTLGVQRLQQEDFAKAEALFTQAVARHTKYPLAHYNLACLYSVTKRLDLALSALRRAIDVGFVNLTSLEADPDLAPLRNLPEFGPLRLEILKNMGQSTAESSPSAEKPETLDGALIAHWQTEEPRWALASMDDLVWTGGTSLHAWHLPDGQLAGELLIPDMPPGCRILCLNSLSSPLLAAGLHDGSVRLLDTVLRCQNASFKGHSAPVRAVQSISSFLLSASSDNTIAQWDLHTGQCIRPFNGHTAPVMDLSVYDAHVFFSCSQDGNVLTWDLRSNKIVQTFEGHEKGAWSVAFLPGQEAVVVGSGVGVLHVWPAMRYAFHPSAALFGHTGKVRSLDVLGWMLLSASEDSTVRVWSLAGGECCATLTGHDGWIGGVHACVPHSAFLSTGKDGTVNMWSANAFRRPRAKGIAVPLVPRETPDPVKAAQKKTKEAETWKTRYYALLFRPTDNQTDASQLEESTQSIASSSAEQETYEWKSRYEGLLRQHEDQVAMLKEKYHTVSAAVVTLEQQLHAQCQEARQQQQQIRELKKEEQADHHKQGVEVCRLTRLLKEMRVLSLMRLRDFKVCQRLSASASHHVILCQPKGPFYQLGTSDMQFVIKVDLTNSRQPEQQDPTFSSSPGTLLHELRCLHTLPNQRNIVTLYTHFEDEYHWTDELNRGYKRRNALCIVQQFCPLSLASALDAHTLTLPQRLGLIEELLGLLVFLHSQGVVHANLSPHSLYVMDTKTLLLGHFRHALRLDPKSMVVTAKDLANWWHGPVELRPPEVAEVFAAETKVSPDHRVDLSMSEVWVVGSIMLVILGISPSKAAPSLTQFLAAPVFNSTSPGIGLGKTTGAADKKQQVARLLAELLSGMLQLDPSERFVPETALRHFNRFFHKGTFVPL